MSGEVVLSFFFSCSFFFSFTVISIDLRFTHTIYASLPLIKPLCIDRLLLFLLWFSSLCRVLLVRIVDMDKLVGVPFGVLPVGSICRKFSEKRGEFYYSYVELGKRLTTWVKPVGVEVYHQPDIKIEA